MSPRSPAIHATRTRARAEHRGARSLLLSTKARTRHLMATQRGSHAHLDRSHSKRGRPSRGGSYTKIDHRLEGRNRTITRGKEAPNCLNNDYPFHPAKNQKPKFPEEVGGVAACRSSDDHQARHTGEPCRITSPRGLSATFQARMLAREDAGDQNSVQAQGCNGRQLRPARHQHSPRERSERAGTKDAEFSSAPGARGSKRSRVRGRRQGQIDRATGLAGASHSSKAAPIPTAPPWTDTSSGTRRSAPPPPESPSRASRSPTTSTTSTCPSCPSPADSFFE